jgi:hypothetical protein
MAGLPTNRIFVASCYGYLGVAVWRDDIECFRFHRTENLLAAGWMPVTASQLEFVADIPGNEDK